MANSLHSLYFLDWKFYELTVLDVIHKFQELMNIYFHSTDLTIFFYSAHYKLFDHELLVRMILVCLC